MQWTKNLLVAAAPIAAGAFDTRSVVRTLVAFGLFCLVSSSTYLANDVMDRDADRLHRDKRRRPIAAGTLSVHVACTVAAIGFVAAMVSAALLSAPFLLVLAGYVTSTLAYSLWLKRVATLELFVVAAGFVFRAIGGAVVTGVPVSGWFLSVTSLVALMIVAGKRASEISLPHAVEHRGVLAEYTLGFLHAVLATTAGAATVTYILWSIESTSLHPGGAVWFQMSSAVFLLALVRYLNLVFAGHGGAPERLVLRDPLLRLSAAVWAVVFCVGVILS